MLRIFCAALIAAFLGAAGAGLAEDFDDNASITSPGGKKIINALVQGQVLPAGQTVPLDEHDIAAMKGDTGWGNVFKRLKMEGRYPDYKNLGQLISSFNRPEREPHAQNGALQRPSKDSLRPDRPTRPAGIEKFDRPSRPERPHRPDKPGRP